MQRQTLLERLLVRFCERGAARINPFLLYLIDNARVSSVQVLYHSPVQGRDQKLPPKKKSRAGWPGFSWRRVGCGYIAARRELALKLLLAGLGPLRLPGSCSFRPVPDRQSQDHSVQVEDPGAGKQTFGTLQPTGHGNSGG